MKLCLLLLILTFTSQAAFTQGNNGLIAHWNFNGNANDASGNGLNGMVTGASLTSGYNGIANTAYKFNGTGDHIDVTYNPLMDLDSYSICVLVKPLGFYSGACQGNYILVKGHETYKDSYGLAIGDNAYDNSCSLFTPTKETFSTTGHGINPPITSYWPDTVVDLNVWYCATVTYKKDTSKLYIDGLLTISLYWPDVYLPQNNGIGIGYYPLGGSSYPYWFNGIIDDIRLYGRPLSAAEVMSYCDSAKMLVVVINPTDSIISVSGSPLCAGSSFSVTYGTLSSFNPGNMFTVQLSDASGSFASPLNIGSISDTVSGTISCTIPSGTSPGTGYKIRIVSTNPVYTSDTSGIVISVGSLATPVIGSNSPICAGKDLIFNASSTTAGVTYNWSGPNGFSSSQQNPTINNASTAASGTYTLTISADGCTNSASTYAIVYPNIVPAFTVSGNLCVGNIITVIADNTSLTSPDYLWYFGASKIISGDGAGPYTLSWNNMGIDTISLAYTGHCKPADTQSFYIQPVPSDHISASKTDICEGDAISLHPVADSSTYTYKWVSQIGLVSDTNTATTFINPTQSGTIYLHIYNQYGCMGTDSVYIKAQPCCQLYVPNAFSPNGDGVNDLFRAHSIRTFGSYQLIIMDRWGEKVYETKDQNAGWDGIFNGAKQGVDVYFYYIKYNCDGNEYTKKGDLTLLR